MATRLLEGLKVLDMAGEPLAMTGRMLADMGADVVKLEPPGGDPLRKVPPLEPDSGVSLRFLAWHAGKTSVEYTADNNSISTLLQGADVVIANILAGPLVELSDTLLAFLKPGGTLMLSGLIESQAETLIAHYGDRVSILVVGKTEGWTCLRGKLAN